MRISGFAVTAAGQPLIPWHYERPALAQHEVLIAVSHCGLCGSDLHFMKNSWGDAQFPMIPGHEIVGTIIECGSAVNAFQPGQRVGVSWQQGACFQCRWCESDQEQFCQAIEGISIGCHGGFADNICADSRFVHAIPDTLASDVATPLFCAGVTVFNALHSCDVSAGMRVGILGIGGLGHLAIQFAAALGCDVTAFSSSPDKAADCERFGASQFILSDDNTALKAQRNKFDIILSTIDRPLDYLPYLEALTPKGALCFVGMPAEPINLAIFPLIIGQRRVCGAQLGNRAMMEQTLAFAAEHAIHPQVEVIAMTDIKQAVERMAVGLARYRLILTNNKT
ncbi:MAG: NAD(P)-dependent alcohol dehydrogenase [Gammaproteobacteria bacterium]|nr:NAD(P)-dependent alcohol dehydrogenase [Gammaproteobacteria bacterium]